MAGASRSRSLFGDFPDGLAGFLEIFAYAPDSVAAGEPDGDQYTGQNR
jgi:hypothetical protein